MTKGEPVIAKHMLHVITHEDLLAKGYILIQDELDLAVSAELDKIISVLPTRSRSCIDCAVVPGGQWLAA